MAKNTLHGLWGNEIVTPNEFVPDVEPTQTLTCWCGQKFGPAPFPKNDLEKQLKEHAKNPPEEADHEPPGEVNAEIKKAAAAKVKGAKT